MNNKQFIRTSSSTSASRNATAHWALSERFLF